GPLIDDGSGFRGPLRPYRLVVRSIAGVAEDGVRRLPRAVHHLVGGALGGGDVALQDLVGVHALGAEAVVGLGALRRRAAGLAGHEAILPLPRVPYRAALERPS